MPLIAMLATVPALTTPAQAQEFPGFPVITYLDASSQEIGRFELVGTYVDNNGQLHGFYMNPENQDWRRVPDLDGSGSIDTELEAEAGVDPDGDNDSDDDVDVDTDNPEQDDEGRDYQVLDHIPFWPVYFDAWRNLIFGSSDSHELTAPTDDESEGTMKLVAIEDFDLCEAALSSLACCYASCVQEDGTVDEDCIDDCHENYLGMSFLSN